jgi:hypothetical protein
MRSCSAPSAVRNGNTCRPRTARARRAAAAA